MVLKALPRFRPMVWGNSELNRIFNLETEAPIGEIWLLSGHPLYETSLEGVGLSLNELSSRIFGKRYPRFPLLVKLVSTNQWLSVQVHPDDEFAKTIEDEPWGKSEAWYFVTDGEFAICEDTDLMKELVNEGRIDEIKDILTFVKVKSGTIVNIPAGTVHALGPNSTVVEVQQSSDLTYRIYDWGRPRETHLEKALKVSRNVKVSDIVFPNAKELRTDYFTIRVFSDNFVADKNILNENLSIIVPLELNKEFSAYLSISDTYAERTGLSIHGEYSIGNLRAIFITLGPVYNAFLEQ
ncbi:type I phosphomannose isomerase catalytic subunit [Fervidobacterium thailandense]|uniref:type I phosphomannose isomerase catalytic subunit n=1 Tax=Fervidobacterium thailandense TaxID=1008305 RepID=UPI000845FE0D|nr:type I phosphomannose isomerase catalytic subunit [Fervidobacterium thailandense]